MDKVEKLINYTRLSIVQGDITLQTTDAIVNAANSTLMGGGGVDGAIHRASGPLILEECKKIVAKHGQLPAGEAVITSGGNLKAKYVIHTVGPIWKGGVNNEAELLASAYRECLKLATKKKLESISFPSISTGAYYYPLEEAAEIAINTIVSFLKNNVTTLQLVEMVTFNPKIYEVYKNTLNKLEK